MKAKHIETIRESLKYSILTIESYDYEKCGLTTEQSIKKRMEKLRELHEALEALIKIK